MSATDDFDQFDDAPAAKPARKTAAKKAPAKRAPRRTTASKIPPTAPKPQDRKPAKQQSGDTARRREADGIEVVDVEDARGFIASIPAHQGDWPLATAQYLSRGEHINGLEALFGEDQWGQYLETKPTVNDAGDMVARISEAIGLGDTGN